MDLEKLVSTPSISAQLPETVDLLWAKPSPPRVDWIYHGITNWTYTGPDPFVSHAKNLGPNSWTYFAPMYPLVEDMLGKGETSIPALGHGVRTAWLITSQACPWTILKSGSFILTFRDQISHICQMCMRVARWTDWAFLTKSKKKMLLKRPKWCCPSPIKSKKKYVSCHVVPISFRANILHAGPCQRFLCQGFLCRVVP